MIATCECGNRFEKNGRRVRCADCQKLKQKADQKRKQEEISESLRIKAAGLGLNREAKKPSPGKLAVVTSAFLPRSRFVSGRMR